MLRKIFNILTIVALMAGFVAVGPTAAMEDSAIPVVGAKAVILKFNARSARLTI